MTLERNKADVVIVGMGWAGSVMAEELTRAGLNVVGIERGAWRDTSTDFPVAIDADELRFHTRRKILQPMSVETTTFRNRSDQLAAPVRNWSAYQFGWNVGGAGTHWAGMSWRFTPWDFEVATQTRERYGAKKMAGLQLQDWGVTYDEMEPFYDRFERIAGTSGYAGNLNGDKRPGGNVFEGARKRDYPTPPLKDTHWMSKYRKTTESMGYHPFTVPAGNLSQAYVNPLGVSMGPCTYCGFCDFHGCGNFSKSSPQACILPVLMRRPNFTLLTETEVLHAVKHEDGKTVKGVKFITQDGVEGFQLADVVCFTAYQMDNVRLMLLSGVGEKYDPLTGRGTIGRNYNYQTCSSVTGFFDNEYMNPFIGGGALAVQIDDFNGDNFDHSDLDFIGGAGIMGFSTNGRPIQNMNGLRPGTKRWGSEWKAGYARDYQTAGTIFCQGTSMPMREAYLDLDPNYKDRHGQPLLRLTFDWNQNDQRMAKYVTDRAINIMKEVGGQHIVVDNQAEKSWNPYMQHSSHTIGGAVMGADPRTSALNPYLQSWDAHNLFVVGASAFPNNGGYNPTVTVGALAVRAAQAIHQKYINNPAPLVGA
ncbi:MULTISPECIES: GMC family oxidoreductase [unclassified Pantoea]|uniref:GMC family oxidoreductase n=1 Tax=unclassified Pantoea TaxID=2630326 RepID=UPI001CD45CB1|nr:MULTISPECIES: GMC family oxidoreductase [unclassified Pantoea]MCA1177419.1 GMC family oxidoreductase [Pantoea sp. alder69]MCA1249675.1 GMC family oxidoreductase [Pantoea sp. alder70]MCA1265908.1 GMC family oxidoreductase [Pantoea sp. alder81]